MAKEETKVFDVAKPGEAKPETGSKPMVVGHKLMKDPSVSETEEKESKEEQPIAQTSKKTIVPISEQEKEPKNTDKVEKDGKIEEKHNEDKTEVGDTGEKDEALPKKLETPESDIQEKSPEDIKKEKDEAALNNEENLQKIINEKKYFVNIEEASYSSVKTFMKTFIVVSLLAVVVLAVLIDLEILDLGITLPFDFL